MLPAFRPVIMGYAPDTFATAKAARNPPRKRGPSAGLVGGYWFVIDHEDASLNKTRIVFVANDLIPYSANVPLEGSTGRIKAFPVLLAYDPRSACNSRCGAFLGSLRRMSGSTSGRRSALN